MTLQNPRVTGKGAPFPASLPSSRTYHDGVAVVSLDTVLIALGFGETATPHFSFRGKVQVVVHNLTPLHEEHGPVLV